jgi:hypothetical protein
MDPCEFGGAAWLAVEFVALLDAGTAEIVGLGDIVCCGCDDTSAAGEACGEARTGLGAGGFEAGADAEMVGEAATAPDVGVGVGVGGGGIEPFGGPYWMIGRICCWFEVCDCCWAFAFPLIAYIVASTTCGSMVMVTVPILDMVSFGGFLGSSVRTPFRLCGLVQYFSNRPSLVHF